MAATLGDEDEVHSTKSAAFAETLEPEVTDDESANHCRTTSLRTAS